jgi:tetratricopeptide (TPR) repeat protein
MWRRPIDSGVHDVRSVCIKLFCFILIACWIAPAHGQDLTFQDLLQSGREALEDGRYDNADRSLRLALATAEGQHGPSSQILLCVADLGNVLLIEGHLVESEKLLNRAVGMLEADPGAEPRVRAIVLGNLGVLYERTGRYARAEASLKEALVLVRRYFGEKDAHVALLLNHLGNLYTEKDELGRAEDSFKKAIAIASQVPTDPRNFAMIQSDFANLYRVEKKWDLSESLSLSALRTVEHAGGTEHPMLIQILDGLGWLYYQRHNLTEAERVLRRSLDIQRKVFGSDSMGVAGIAGNLAVVIAERSKYAEKPSRSIANRSTSRSACTNRRQQILQEPLSC